MLDEGQFGNALIYSPFNYEKAKAFGAEISVDYHKNNFKSFANLATQKMKAININSSQYLFEQDELDIIRSRFVNVDHDQSYSFSAGSSYLWHKNLFSGDIIYGSGLRHGNVNGNKLPSYWQANASFARSFELPKINKIDSRISLLNLLNNKYKIRDGSGIGVGAPQYQNGRSL